jgi:hypothetical protein
LPGIGPTLRGPAPVAEQAEKVDELVREVLGTEAGRAAPQRRRRERVGPGRPADAKVDPSRMQRFEEGELLGDDERRMVGQHHTAGADANPLGRGGQMGDQYGRRGAGDRREVVVLGDPEAVIAELLGTPRQGRRLRQRGRRAPPSGDDGEIEYR